MRLVKYVLFIVVTSSLASYGMSGDRGDAVSGFPCGLYAPSLPGLPRDPQSDPAVAQVLEDIAQSWLKKEEKREKRPEESLEPAAKRRKRKEEEDTAEQTLPREPQVLSTTIATTTTSTTSMQSRQESFQQSSLIESELGDLRAIDTPMESTRESSSLPVWEESEWANVLQAIDQRSAREYREDAEEWFGGFVPNIQDIIFRREPTLINTIADHFFEREVTLEELNAGMARWPFIIRLRVIAEHNQSITQEQIQLIGQRFPNIRELSIPNTGLNDQSLYFLSQQPFARQLILLDISHKRGEITTAGIERAMRAFTNLLGLDISISNVEDYSAGICHEVLEVLPQQPFARNLTYLNISGLGGMQTYQIENMKAFIRLTHLRFSENGLNDDDLIALAQQPFAPHLIELDLSGNRELRAAGLEGAISAFTSLKRLRLADCEELGDTGLAVVANQPFAQNLTLLDIQAIELDRISDNMVSFVNLAYLSINGNCLDDESLAVIARMPFAGNLIELDVSDSNITTAAIRAYMYTFKNLRRLRMEARERTLNEHIAQLTKPLGDEGLAELIKLPFATRLARLEIACANITVLGVKYIANGFTGLTTLDISENLIGDEGLEILAAQPFARNLRLIARSVNATEEWLKQNKHRFKELIS